jgi:dihydroorotate dehydrogenase
LEKRVNRRDGIVGVNLGKNKDGEAEADYGAGVRALAPYADYLVINVSSPNTPGLRALQSAEILDSLIAVALRARSDAGAAPPLLLKLAPDLGEAELRISRRWRRPVRSMAHHRQYNRGRPSSLGPHMNRQGPAAPPALSRSAALVYRLTEGRMTLIGSAGFPAARMPMARSAGASWCSSTALVYQGRACCNAWDELAQLLRRDGFASGPMPSAPPPRRAAGWWPPISSPAPGQFNDCRPPGDRRRLRCLPVGSLGRPA